MGSHERVVEARRAAKRRGDHESLGSAEARSAAKRRGDYNESLGSAEARSAAKRRGDYMTALASSHLRQLLRPRRAPWFDHDDGEVTEVMVTIGSLVQSTPCRVTESTPLREVERMLVEHQLGAVPVIDAGRSLCGVVTCADVLRAGAEWTAADAMSRAVTIRANASVDAAAALVARDRAEHIVVTDGVGQPIGIVTASEIVRHLAVHTRTQ